MRDKVVGGGCQSNAQCGLLGRTCSKFWPWLPWCNHEIHGLRVRLQSNILVNRARGVSGVTYSYSYKFRVAVPMLDGDAQECFSQLPGGRASFGASCCLMADYKFVI